MVSAIATVEQSYLIQATREVRDRLRSEVAKNSDESAKMSRVRSSLSAARQDAG